MWVQRRRPLGIIPTTRLRLHNADPVLGLADSVATALHDAIGGRPVAERTLVVGLLAALGQVPVVFRSKDLSRHHGALESIVVEAIPPVAHMRKVVEDIEAHRRAALHHSEHPA